MQTAQSRTDFLLSREAYTALNADDITMTSVPQPRLPEDCEVLNVQQTFVYSTGYNCADFCKRVAQQVFNEFQVREHVSAVRVRGNAACMGAVQAHFTNETVEAFLPRIRSLMFM